MSRKSPRYIPVGALVEITARTVGARFLLRPSPVLNAMILATLGRALSLQPVDLHAIAFMSNHWHALVSVADALALSRFVQHVHSNIARTVNALHDWDGPVFSKPSFIIVAEGAEEARLHYVLSQGAKEGLVRRPVDWPGVHCARALLHEEVLVGMWNGREHERLLRIGGGNGGGRVPLPREVRTVYPIEFTPLPSWTHLDAGQRVLRVREMLNEIERNARNSHPHPIGVAAVLAQDPLARPAKSKRGTAPPIHTPDADERASFIVQRKTIREQLLVAKDDLRAQRRTTVPAACFPPVPPFRNARTALWSAVRDEASDTAAETGQERLDQKRGATQV